MGSRGKGMGQERGDRGQVTGSYDAGARANSQAHFWSASANGGSQGFW